MFDRAPRNTAFVVGNTPSNVGPGSYNGYAVQSCAPKLVHGGKYLLKLSVNII